MSLVALQFGKSCRCFHVAFALFMEHCCTHCFADLFLDAQRDLTAARNATDAARVDFTLARLLLFQQLELLDIDEQGLVIDWARVTAGAEENESDETENEDGE